MNRSFVNLIVFCAVAWSGFFIMCLELLGARLLAPYYGNSIFVWGGIIFVFMTLLSAGYLIGGKLSLNNPSMTTLGVLLFLEAVLAIPVVTISTKLLETLSIAVPDPRYGSMLGAIGLFGLSTLASGAVTPYAIRFMATEIDSVGASAGRLIFCSTLGSAAGTLITSFYLVLLFEINTILWMAILISMFTGLFLMGFGRLIKKRNVAVAAFAISPLAKSSDAEAEAIFANTRFLAKGDLRG